jgi:hypothetical protein
MYNIILGAGGCPYRILPAIKMINNISAMAMVASSPGELCRTLETWLAAPLVPLPRRPKVSGRGAPAPLAGLLVTEEMLLLLVLLLEPFVRIAPQPPPLCSSAMTAIQSKRSGIFVRHKLIERIYQGWNRARRGMVSDKIGRVCCESRTKGNKMATFRDQRGPGVFINDYATKARAHGMLSD